MFHYIVIISLSLPVFVSGISDLSCEVRCGIEAVKFHACANIQYNSTLAFCDFA